MVNDPSNLQRRMNQALDQALSESEFESLQEQLATSRDNSEQWQRMQQVDQLLRTTPLVGPSSGFAARVIAAIERLRLDELADRQISVGVALGLMAAALLTIPFLSVALIVLVSTLSSPSTVTALFQGVTSGTSYAIDLVVDLIRVMRDLATDTPMVPALLTTMIPLGMVWAWLLWYLSGRTRVKAE
ncbi:MAG TPA: hypothetical protein PKD09_04350 [Aggregatilinea sp.]|jgi:hypothetical protein|uniref:hypothetical protein n=1 Tax=Aggregatilinea sp. TaxID=2806333 RepID=UPI002C920A24|nr:hypothetical protein [Aggregatilinea sp.]HML20854.1 hypothetical protein [Aggregatilinea sp.]